jgi:hypothetical protein
MQDSASDLAIDCEVELIKLSENLAQYSHDATRKAAGYELAFQKRMSER